MVKILAALVAALSILNSSGASPGATEKAAALVTLLLFLYELSIVVIIVITNMYSVNSYNKNNIKMHFPEIGFLNFNFILLIHYTSQRDEINCVVISKAFSTM